MTAAKNVREALPQRILDVIERYDGWENLLAFIAKAEKLSATAAGDGPAVPSDHWYCPHCNAAVHPQSVTYQETHDPRFNGCGWPVFPDVKSALAAQESP